MSQFASVFIEKFDAAKPVNAKLNSRKTQGFTLQLFHRRQTLWIKRPCPGCEQRIEEVGHPGNSRQPTEMTHYQVEDHGRSGNSARRRISSITRKCTARKICWVHKSKYHAGRTCSEYQVLPDRVVLPSLLRRSTNCPRCGVRWPTSSGSGGASIMSNVSFSDGTNSTTRSLNTALPLKMQRRSASTNGPAVVVDTG